MARRIKAVQSDAIRLRLIEAKRETDPEERRLYLVKKEDEAPESQIEKGYQYVPPRMTWREKFREIRKILKK